MKATNKAGHVWTEEKTVEGASTRWIYKDHNGDLYESSEIPVYRIRMDNATQAVVDGKLTITPLP